MQTPVLKVYRCIRYDFISHIRLRIRIIVNLITVKTIKNSLKRERFHGAISSIFRQAAPGDDLKKLRTSRIII